MRGILLACVGPLFLAACASTAAAPGAQAKPAGWQLAIHGGAGVIVREQMTPEKEAAYRAALDRALDAGALILSTGGSSLDAVEAAVKVMEDDPLFNAGHGSVFTDYGGHELDASIMDGRDRRAGAVAGVTVVRNPVEAARAVMERSGHVLFAGPGADAFAQQAGLALVPNTYFDTEARRQALERVLDERSRAAADRHGTVGAVAMDMHGNLAAATTTGGMTAKPAGRVGDSPIIGAGTYAWNGVCAVSATGHGEYFIRIGVAKSICDRVALKGEDIVTAAETVLAEVAALGGDGGVILIGPDGKPGFAMNSPGMYRGTANASGRTLAIYRDE